MLFAANNHSKSQKIDNDDADSESLSRQNNPENRLIDYYKNKFSKKNTPKFQNFMG